MADITDPRVVRWSNQGVRKMAEVYRLAYLNAKRLEMRWTDEIGALVSNSPTDMLIDGRESQGISQLSGEELTRIRKVNKDFIDWYEGVAVSVNANIESKLGKASVRTLVGDLDI